LKREPQVQIKFISSNHFKVQELDCDSLQLVKQFLEIFYKPKKSNIILIIDSKNRLYSEYVILIGQFHRALLRAKDEIAIAKFRVRYKKLDAQAKIDLVDKFVPDSVIAVE
jgi:hypothetical protein